MFMPYQDSTTFRPHRFWLKLCIFKTKQTCHYIREQCTIFSQFCPSDIFDINNRVHENKVYKNIHTIEVPSIGEGHKD